MRGLYNGCTMSVYGSVIPGARRLAGLGVELSKPARQRLKWFDYYNSHGHNARLTCRYFGISPQTFYRWKRRYNPHHLESLEDRSQVTKAREKLDKGAVALCIFVEQELAHISWVAMTEEAKKMVDPLPYKVDFANSEACMGGAWTNPKYRRMGLMEYGVYKRRQFQVERGLGIARGSIAARNVPSAGVAAKVGSNMYAEAHYLRILWWKCWKEKPLAQDNGFG